MKEVVLLVSPSCPSCDAIKKFLRGKGLLNRYKIIDVSTTEGLDFARRLGVNGVPECAVIEGNEPQKVVRICTTDEWKNMLEGK